MAVFPLDCLVHDGIQIRHLAPVELQLAAVLFGYVPRLDKRLQRRLDLVRAQDEDLGHGDGVKPALDPAPHGAEEHGRADDEDAVECLRVVGRGQRAGGLHVALEIPELPEADARDVDDVGAQRDRGFVVRPVGQVGAQRLGEAREVLVQGEQAEELGRRVAVCLGVASEGVCCRLLVAGDGLGVEVLDLEEVKGDAAFISPASPLGVL